MDREVFITKADGEREIFDVAKLEESLSRAGASAQAQSQVIDYITKELRDGMTTNDIYRHAFTKLQDIDNIPVAARYSIKRAILDLGPSGFPFEQFVAALLRADGWSASTGLAMTGRCAPHEVDVLAKKDGHRVGIEVKFHNTAGAKTDLKDALYVHARFEDLKVAPDERDRVTEGWLVTNTRFTRNAIRYGRCAGLKMVGWDYPSHHSLLSMIEASGLHPLTCLTTLAPGEKRQLLDANIVLCSAIKNDEELLRQYGVPAPRIAKIREEAGRLCSPLDTQVGVGEH